MSSVSIMVVWHVIRWLRRIRDIVLEDGEIYIGIDST
jgi:hypothetical protein